MLIIPGPFYEWESSLFCFAGGESFGAFYELLQADSGDAFADQFQGQVIQLTEAHAGFAYIIAFSGLPIFLSC